MSQFGPLDLVGVGFGPSNLALTVAVAEYNTESACAAHLRARFVERQGTFGWHRGMLLEDATMQVSFLKDLVTLRNPASRYGFLSYLHERGRLVDFINYGSVFPTRLEFHDYLEWVAGRFADQVDYGTEVTSIDPVPESPDLVDVVTSRGTVLRTRNVVLATGLTPNLPEGVEPGERIWHTRDLLTRLDRVADPKRVIVVGAGQSAAEAVEHIHRRFAGTEVWAVFHRYGYSPADDSSFANRVFDPDAVDDFFRAPDRIKRMILGYHANTNYSVVDPDLIESLYRRHYHEKVAGRERLRFLNVSRVADVVATDDHVELAVESLIHGGREVLGADLVIYATGYRSSDPCDLLGDLAASCLRDDAGRLDIGRDYRIRTDPGLRAGLYVQGATEHTHGLSSTLLSNIAVRSGEIVRSIAAPAPAHV
ncbi:lysine N(6)-hydroxylase/L-ornithine N(5)-oxygenase family protein [Pseudonocardia sp. RS11V-5]|uniref:lysine N(6)-hydroxylase/L-ornithine N(5)-oxygenase family protein n=1 Tax=Pseudonocardia terrae TaxID=2905831 RepID=UPI001E463E84|nr:SidA/IucD/PvdA family monooxygenase [Pseudonocardia terrae]MCE3554394.1 lysine N(6)-hydroxylase/L-ornithine N(5)-oxygenase family protein [Pseudonocardia terrae]